MERFYGFRIDIDSELDPIHIEAMKEVASKIISAYDFNSEEYFIYFHQLSIRPKDVHFNMAGGLSERLKRVELSFSVNPKQRKKRQIKLFNFLLDKPSEDQVKWTGGSEKVTYYLDGKYLAKNLGFRNEIVTFISKKVRYDHRKIKVSVVAFPTDNFFQCFKKQTDNHLTQLDFKFKKPILLRPPINIDKSNSKKQKILNEHKSGVTVMGDGDVYINNGQSAAMGKKAKADNTTLQQVILKNENMEELKLQLELLRSEMRKVSKSTEDDLSVVEIGKAIEFVGKGDKNKVLEHLKNSGKKALEISEKIGISLVTAILKQELGI